MKSNAAEIPSGSKDDDVDEKDDDDDDEGNYDYAYDESSTIAPSSDEGKEQHANKEPKPAAKTLAGEKSEKNSSTTSKKVKRDAAANVNLSPSTTKSVRCFYISVFLLQM